MMTRGDTDGRLALMVCNSHRHELKTASWLPYTNDSPGGKWYWRGLIRSWELRSSSGKAKARMEHCYLIGILNLQAWLVG